MKSHIPSPPARTRGRAAFTLPEMLTVVFIVTLLAALLIAGAITAQRRARQAKCIENLSVIGRELVGYASEHDGDMAPFDRDLATDNDRDYWYVEILAYRMQTYRESKTIDLNRPPESSEIFHCPSDRDYGFTRDRLSYGLNADVMYSDGRPYTFDLVESASPSGNDLDCDAYNISRIVNKAQFILVADTGPITLQSGDPTNRNYRSWISPPKLGHNRPISGPHSGKANILYADGHVDEVDFGQYSPPRDNFPTTDADWFRQWTLGNE